MAASRPTVDELLEATQEFLEKKIIDTVDSHRAFHTRVAVNVLALVRRELRMGPQLARDEHERLRSLLGIDGTVAELNGELCSRLRDKSMDCHDEELFRHLFATTMGQLSIDNPEYSGYKRALEESSKA
ncbi:MAG TPA: DUF6285 domain-containing protein [Syntrophales bacterium]|nr:DUF6285 domain-containing protein [Syntrophales bacterium]HPQ44462.1 DUF6285 domain-containing protein [Syntrophales bacterium]